MGNDTREAAAESADDEFLRELRDVCRRHERSIGLSLSVAALMLSERVEQAERSPEWPPVWTSDVAEACQLRVVRERPADRAKNPHIDRVDFDDGLEWA